ncbi:hypothetical protein RclHR1_10200012 [Rhizophagus clarus]|uniref:Uncharacterized protein n=1 Tax=Rhizophagus clarus TaxID=94130 RepID=A0A2Z6Q222_9GLOM|nr:hypothetical protein RclHR1_10200012 [Rhizophagus clarus]
MTKVDSCNSFYVRQENILYLYHIFLELLNNSRTKTFFPYRVIFRISERKYNSDSKPNNINDGLMLIITGIFSELKINNKRNDCSNISAGSVPPTKKKIASVSHYCNRAILVSRRSSYKFNPIGVPNNFVW